MAARLAAIEEANRQLRERALSDEARWRAHEEAHKLAGSIGTFGFLEASRLARKAEELLGRKRALGEDDAHHLAEIVGELKEQIARATTQAAPEL